MREAMVGTTRPPQQLSQLHVWSVTVGGTLFCISLALFAQWLLYQHWHFHSFRGFRWGTSLVMVPAVATMLRLLMYQAQRRRRVMIKRFMVVAEANHHIRNAFAALVGANWRLQGTGPCADTSCKRRKIDLDLPKTYAVIEEALERIEGTLAEVLPQLNDKD
jgi:hypothetical protein